MIFIKRRFQDFTRNVKDVAIFVRTPFSKETSCCVEKHPQEKIFSCCSKTRASFGHVRRWGVLETSFSSNQVAGVLRLWLALTIHSGGKKSCSRYHDSHRGKDWLRPIQAIWQVVSVFSSSLRSFISSKPASSKLMIKEIEIIQGGCSHFWSCWLGTNHCSARQRVLILFYFCFLSV